MNPLSELYNQLLAGGYPPDQIPDIIRRLGAAQQAGMFQNLNIGTAEQDRADRQAEQARLAQEFRVQTGLGALGLMQNDEQQRAQREGDPFRFVEYLRGVSQLPQGAAGNPVSSLIGQGFSIKPQLPTDPKYNSLLDDIASFGKPRGAASGAKVQMSEPGVLVGMSGKPYTTVNENGAEDILKVTPKPGMDRRLDPAKQQGIIDRVMGKIAPGENRYPQGGTPPTDPAGIGGRDLNGDGTINSGDQGIAARRQYLLQGIGGVFGSMQGQPNFNPAFDLNNDGRINVLDSQAASRWLPQPRLQTGRPVYGMAGGGDLGGFASAEERQAAIRRLAATPGAAEAFANYDRQRSQQDPSFGSSTSTTARPNGQVAYIHTADGRVEAVANPVGLGPGNWENVVGPDGVGHWQPIDETRTRELAQQTQQAYFDRMHQLGSGPGVNTQAHQNLLQILADAGGRPGSIMPSMALSDRQRSPYVTYPAAYPGGPNIINIQGNGTKGLGGYNQTAQLTGGTYNTTLYNGQYGHADPNYRDDTYRPAGMAAGGSVSPAQAAAMAMGKALANNPFAPTELVRDLQAGNAANPAYLNQRLRANIDPNLWQGLLSTNQGFGYRPDSVLASAQQYDIPTFNTYYKRF